MIIQSFRRNKRIIKRICFLTNAGGGGRQNRVRPPRRKREALFLKSRQKLRSRQHFGGREKAAPCGAISKEYPVGGG